MYLWTYVRNIFDSASASRRALSHNFRRFVQRGMERRKTELNLHCCIRMLMARKVRRGHLPMDMGDKWSILLRLAGSILISCGHGHAFMASVVAVRRRGMAGSEGLAVNRT